MTYPTAAVTTTNLDAGTDSPATARSDLLDAVQKLNQMIAHTTAFAATLLDDTTAAAARTTLGAAESGANTSITSLGNNTSTVYTTAGTSTAYTITPTPVIAAYAIGQSFFVNFNAACGAAPTITISGVATPPNLVKENSDGTFSNLAAGDIPINHRSRVTLISTTQALVEKMPQVLTLGTSVATTSGTAIDFTSIPTWVKRITLMLNGVSTSGTGDLILRMGAGSVLSSGYVGNVGLIRNGGTSNNYAFSTSFIIASEVGAADTYSGSVVLTLLGSNIWTINGCVSGGSIRTNCCCGVVPVGGTNDRIRFTTSTGDTFDAGSVNITYE